MHEQLEHLKQSLIQATEFAKVLEEFFDLVETPGFLDMGQRVSDEVLEEVLRVTAAQLGGGRLRNVLLVSLDDHGVVHGSFTLGARMGSVLYFNDVRMGLASAVDMATGDTRMARFTASRLYREPSPSGN